MCALSLSFSGEETLRGFLLILSILLVSAQGPISLQEVVSTLLLVGREDLVRGFSGAFEVAQN